MDHAQDCKAVVNKNITEFMLAHKNILMSVNEKMIGLNDEISRFMNPEMQFSLTDFLRLIRVLKKFKVFSTHLDQEEEHKENSSEFDFLWK